MNDGLVEFKTRLQQYEYDEAMRSAYCGRGAVVADLMPKLENVGLTAEEIEAIDILESSREWEMLPSPR